MESIDLQSMSLDELWALHETICLILARKLEAEKRSHEQRLNELGRRIGKAANATPLRRPYPKVFVPSVRSPTRRTKTFSKGGSPLSDFVNANIIQAFPGRNQFADPTWQVATTRPCLMRRFWISKFRMDLWIGSTLGGLVGGLSELPPQFIKPLFV